MSIQFKRDRDDFKNPSTEDLKFKEISQGLSMTKNGRLCFTTGLQNELGLNPVERENAFYVKVLFYDGEHEDKQFIFSLQFFQESNRPSHAKYKFYKPKRKSILTSYFEFARFLKARNLISSVGEASKYLNGGAIEIIDKDLDEKAIIISLKNRFTDIKDE